MNVSVAKCIFSSVPPHFHNFLLRTLKEYEKSFHFKKKFLLNCSTNLTTSEKINMPIIRRLSTFINRKQQWMHSEKILIRSFKIDGAALVAPFSGTICDKVMIFFYFIPRNERNSFLLLKIQ